MGYAIVLNASESNVTIRKSGHNQTLMGANNGSFDTMTTDINSKYEVKYNDELIAKFWVDADSWIYKFKNYHEKLFISVTLITTLGTQYSQLKTSFNSYYVPQFLVITNRSDKHKLIKSPLIVN